MADGLQPRAQGILNTIGQMLPAGRQPSGAWTYPFVPPERVPESLPAPLMGVSAPMPMAEPEPEYQPTPEEGADALVRLGNTSLKQAAARAKRATIPEREAELPPEERRKDQGALKVLGGFLGNREAMAQLAIAFNSMRLRPDAGLAASMQKIVEQGGVQRGANRTAEVLRARGREDLAALVEQNPALAQDALKELMGGGKEAPSKVREYQYAVEQGYSGSYMDFLAEQRAQAPSVEITTGPQVGTIPQGYQLTSQDGAYRMEPIPGGPVQTEMEQVEKQQKAEAARAEDSIQLINSILDDPALPSITGMIQGRLPPLTQEGTDLLTKLNQLQGQTFLEAFERLKGGGAITVTEGLKGEEAIARLQRVQSTEAYKQSLEDLRDIIDRGRRRALGENLPDLFQSGGVTVGEPY